ncbi:hypothetical protein [Kordiimonas gwangyangensis]|uniref:hypothetical protein n=1 Tax=Kordiimonas gwangyangensis TaxID=288022 RepID=UPI000381DCBE|nr:hypothetical protein [Kordiimonas gwangyangensis]
MKYLAAASIAALLTTGVQSAPSRDKTVAYIQKQCEGTPTGSGPVTSNVQIEGTVLRFTEGVPVDASARGDVAFWQEVRTIDLRDVKKIDALGTFLQLQCDYNCASVEGFYLGTDGRRRQPSWGNKSGTSHMTYANLSCRNTDRAVNAIQHLKDLSGESEKDPFAN